MKTKHRIEYYKDDNGEHRWRIKRNGKIIADSGEGYKRKSTMVRAITNLIEALQVNRFTIFE